MPSVGISSLAGALCTLLSEAWLRGSMLVRKVGWEEVGMCGQWSQKQGNAYKNTEEGGSGYEEEDREGKEEANGVLQQWQGRQDKTLAGWMLALGRRQQDIKAAPPCLSFALAAS